MKPKPLYEGPNEREALLFQETGTPIVRGRVAHSKVDDILSIGYLKLDRALRTSPLLQEIRPYPERLAGYIRALIRNTIIDDARSESRRLIREQRYAAGQPDTDTVGARDTSGIEQYLGRKLVAAEIDRLRPRIRRACATLVWIEGHTIAEAATTLDMSVEKVRYQMRKANESIATRLSKADLY